MQGGPINQRRLAVQAVVSKEDGCTCMRLPNGGDTRRRFSQKQEAMLKPDWVDAEIERGPNLQRHLVVELGLVAPTDALDMLADAPLCEMKGGLAQHREQVDLRVPASDASNLDALVLNVRWGARATNHEGEPLPQQGGVCADLPQLLWHHVADHAAERQKPVVGHQLPVRCLCGLGRHACDGEVPPDCICGLRVPMQIVVAPRGVFEDKLGDPLDTDDERPQIQCGTLPHPKPSGLAPLVPPQAVQHRQPHLGEGVGGSSEAGGHPQALPIPNRVGISKERANARSSNNSWCRFPRRITK